MFILLHYGVSNVYKYMDYLQPEAFMLIERRRNDSYHHMMSLHTHFMSMSRPDALREVWTDDLQI